MSDERNNAIEDLEISSLEEIEGLDPFRSMKLVCPNLSQIAGKPIVVRVRALQPMDLFKVSNFPLAEIHRMAEEQATGEDFSKAMAEHLKAFNQDDMAEMMRGVLKVCVVEPEPTAKALRNLESDLEFLFTRIMEKTTPQEVAATAAEFREE